MSRVARLLFASLLAAAQAQASGIVVAGRDRASILPPAGAVVEAYRNAGYDLRFVGGGVEVTVDNTPLHSVEPLALPPSPPADEVGRLGRGLAEGSATRVEAAGRILAWIAANVRYELDRGRSQEPAAVLERRSAYCTGTARLAVALLAAAGIDAREVPGYVLEDQPGGPRAGFHRWIEILLPDRGWVFADPLASHFFVPATYLRLAAEDLEDSPGRGRLIDHSSALEAIDLAPLVPDGVAVRANDERRMAATLVVRVDAAGPRDQAILEGEGVRRVAPIERGSARFLGLGAGHYELKVSAAGRLAAWKAIVFRAPVLAELVIPGGPPAARSGSSR